MVKRIVIENFMSHRRTEIEPAEGLTVLTGPNNCGKSAVVVALQTVCQNERASKAFVRHGAKEARVTIETADGHTVTWTRGKEVSYRIDDREVHRLKGGTPDDLHKVLRLDCVDAEGGNFDIHFAEQKSPIFLLDQPGSKAATFFAASSDAGLLLKIQGLHKERVRDAKREEWRLAAEVERSSQELDCYGGLPALEERVGEVERVYSQLSDAIAGVESLLHLREALAETHATYQRRRVTAEALADVSPPPALDDTNSVALVLQRLRQTRDAHEMQELRVNAFKQLEEAPEFDDTATLDVIASRIASQERYVTKLESRLECVAHLGTPPTVAEDPELVRTITGLQQALARIAAAHEALAKAESDLSDHRARIQEFVARDPVCPTCGGRISAAQLMEVRT